jgi:hypothetical protein
VLRKLLALVILGSVPVLSFGAAQVVTSGVAGAASTVCTGVAPGQTITFASPGLSALGTAQVSKKSKTAVSSGTLSCTKKTKTKSGTAEALTITTKATKADLCQNDSNPPSPCPTGDYVYDSADEFASTASTLFKDVPSESWTVGSTTYTATFTSSGAASSCAADEVGFTLGGKLTAPSADAGKAVTVVACLLGDTGPNTTGNFAADIETELGNSSSNIVIATATLDPSDSTITFA